MGAWLVLSGPRKRDVSICIDENKIFQFMQEVI